MFTILHHPARDTPHEKNTIHIMAQILRPVKFKKGSEAAEELEFILCDVAYETEWHDHFDADINTFMKTGCMTYALAQEVHFRFRDMRTYTGYDECRRYRRAVESIIERTAAAFPEMDAQNQFEY